jgi:NAD(P)-dependent dehydrogenase (short-subunit alcohol dehydrogenase family)
MDLTGKGALVTGGASGIGAAAVRRLAAAGARVAVADRNEEAARELAGEVGGIALAGDVADPARMAAHVAAAEDAFGRLDVVLLNAGVTAGQSGVEDLDLAGYRRIVGVNVDHVVFGLTAAVPALRRAGGGRVIATASLAGLVPMPGDALYTMTKHAVVGYARPTGSG